jgi:uncharacterized protein
MPQPTARDLDRERYVSLETFRRSGAAIATPVWAAELEGKLYVLTDGTSAKVKRLRATPRARLAPCDWRGNLTGPWREARGRVVQEPELIERANAALARKYGWQVTVLNIFSTIGGRIGRRAILELAV